MATHYLFTYVLTDQKHFQLQKEHKYVKIKEKHSQGNEKVRTAPKQKPQNAIININ